MITKKKKENEFQLNLKKRIYEEIPGVVILKNNPNDILGIPDLTILGNGGKYAILECKKDVKADYQPLQEFYLDKFGNDLGAYASKIEPSNEDKVIKDLVEYFK